MPEGHTVHRIANSFNKVFSGKKVRVSSPQGRFTQADLVSGKKLVEAKAHGKQMFLHFGKAIVRIHLGIYGKWSFQHFLASPPEPVGEVRARFLIPNQLADLRGPTACEVIDEHQLQQTLRKLGPDPLSKDQAGKNLERFVDRAHSSSRPIAELLMNQSVIAGVGNVYRAELLYRARLNPYVPGKKTPKELLESIWLDAQRLMPIGVRTGMMLTRDGYLKGKPDLADRYYVYKRAGERCRECSAKVVMEILTARKLYFCPRCQK
jgi:DNA-formamidopyrimidine glycosylase